MAGGDGVGTAVFTPKMRVLGSSFSPLVPCGHIQDSTVQGSLWVCPSVQRRVTLLGMAGLAIYLPPSHRGVLPPRNKEPEWSGVVGKESMRGGGEAPRTGPKPQGSRGLSPYGQFSLVAQEEETSSCFRHSWADGETGHPGTHSLLQRIRRPAFPSEKWGLSGPPG